MFGGDDDHELTPREETISELEELGYDLKHPSDYDWRAIMSDAELTEALDALKAELDAAGTL